MRHIFATTFVLTLTSRAIQSGLKGSLRKGLLNKVIKKEPRSIEELAQTINPHLEELIQAWQKQGLLPKVNIVTVDWYTQNNVISQIIMINLKR